MPQFGTSLGPTSDTEMLWLCHEMTSGDGILMAPLRSKLSLLPRALGPVLPCRRLLGHSQTRPHCCGLWLKPQTHLLPVPLGTANLAACGLAVLGI